MGNLTGIRSLVLAAAEGLAYDDEPDATEEMTLVGLVVVGDVLRAFTDSYSVTGAINPTLRSWLRACDQRLLAGAVRMHAETVRSLSAHRDDASLPFSMPLRDQARSILASLYWRCFSVSHSRDLLSAMKDLDTATSSFDAALAENGITADEIEAMIGDRSTLSTRYIA